MIKRGLLVLLTLARLLNARDVDGDTAPFVVVVEHGDGWRCGGALLSMLHALTSAWCARPRPNAPEPLRAIAGAALAEGVARTHAVRRVAGVATPTPPVPTAPALLELEAPFSIETQARPILAAVDPSECSAMACHAVRVIRHGETTQVHLRVVSAMPIEPVNCSPASNRWDHRALCLRGQHLCTGDRGAPVVCTGKLCAVVTRTAKQESLEDPDGIMHCGEPVTALSVPRWKAFLQCAHTLHACGRSECAGVCSERRLMQPMGTRLPSPQSSSPPGPQWPLPPPPPPRVSSLRPAAAPEWEPNRADFRAGEYDNAAAEYGAVEDAPPVRSSLSLPSPTTEIDYMPEDRVGLHQNVDQPDDQLMRIAGAPTAHRPCWPLGALGVLLASACLT